MRAGIYILRLLRKKHNCSAHLVLLASRSMKVKQGQGAHPMCTRFLSATFTRN